MLMLSKQYFGTAVAGLLVLLLVQVQAAPTGVHDFAPRSYTSGSVECYVSKPVGFQSIADVQIRA